MSSSHRGHRRSAQGSARRGRILVFLIGITAVVCMAIALPLLLSSPPTTHGVTATDTPGGIAGNTPGIPGSTPGGTQGLPLPSLPSMVPVGQSSFQPDPSLNPGDGAGIVATRIRIPGLSIDLKIVEGDGLDAPLFKAAHYPGSAWPGGGSNIYLYAHARDGMFIALWDARVGDQVFLDLKDGTTRTYVVDEVDRNVPWNALDFLKPTPIEQLTLQTCVSYGETAPRFVVIAHPAT